MVKIEHEDNGIKGSFVIYVDNKFAGKIRYLWEGNSKFIINHTGIEKEFTRRGLAKQLILKAIEFARANNLKIVPLCSYAKRIFDNDSSLNDVLYIE